MAFRISMEELGIAGDNAVFEGAAPGDVWRKVAEHLKETRGIDLPDPGDLFGSDDAFLPPRFDNAIPGQQAVIPGVIDRNDLGDDRGTNIIVTRLIEKLRMGQSSPGGQTLPPGGGKPLVP